MSDREEMLHAFLAVHGCDIATLRLVAGDASNRKYYRVHHADQLRIVMDAPPEKGEDVRPFIQIARWLLSVGLSAPRLIEIDEASGFLLIEDLGDDLFARLLEQGRADEETLYHAAMDVLLQIQRADPPYLMRYSAEKMSELAALSADWYLPGATGCKAPESSQSLRKLMTARLAQVDIGPRVLIQRDYHAENLLWLPDRTGVERVGLLDFQDAMIGHPAYDLVSVLQDARRDVPPQVQADMLNYFISASGSGPEFVAQYHLLGLQRNLRILGVFARLCLRDGKVGYVDLIPRVWGHVVRNLDALGDADLTRCVHDTLPEPNEARLDRIRAARP